MIVYTGGTFDLIHPGHVSLLQQCRELAGPGGRVVVGLNRDEFVVRYKRRSPVMTYMDRKASLLALRDVDMVVPNIGDEDSRPAIEFVEPDIIAIGADWYDDPLEDTGDGVIYDGWDRYRAQMGFDSTWLEVRGIKLASIPLLEGRSSTALRDAVR